MCATFRSVKLGDYTGGVIGTKFLVADTAGPGADGGCGGFEGYGSEACGEVRAYGGGDDVEEGGARRADTEGSLSADYGGAEVEGVAWCALGDVSIGWGIHGVVVDDCRVRGEDVLWYESLF